MNKWWKKRLADNIPFLEERVVMLADNYFFRELASVEGEPLAAPIDEFLDNLKLSLLSMELLSGWEYIQKELNGDYPIPFLFALLETFDGAELWIDETGTADVSDYLTLFFGAYGENRVIQDAEFQNKRLPADCFDLLGVSTGEAIDRAKLPEEVDQQLRLVLEVDLVRTQINSINPVMH
jgi:hypothetical protein